MNKNAIKKFAIDARNKLIASVTDKAGMLGITPDNCSEAITKGADFEVYKTAAGTEVTLNKKQCEQRRKLVDQIHARGFEAVVEEVAYTWFNRICAIRFMEVNDYMYPVRVRVLSSEKEGKNEPDVVTMAPEIDWDFTDKEREEIIDAKMNNRLDDLFRMLFIKQCNLLHEVLPGLFEETEDYTEMLLNISFTNEDDVIRMLVDEKRGIPEEDFNVNTIGEDGQPTGQVEIIGWLYQYYNTELKDDTFAKLKKNVKITKERIPAATQLFTPDWIVRYMVENSVGRIWIEHLRAVDPSTDEKATAERFGWKYYLPEAEQEESVNIKLAEIRTTYKDLKPTDITCIDPCMGSGHILIAMFDVLMDIYESAGYDKREAAFDIVEHNIHGLDIDQRAYQLAYFAVMMKGRGYNRRFLSGKDGKPEPKVYAIMESNDIEKRHLQFFGVSMPEIERAKAVEQVEYLLHTFVDAREYGSILKVGACDWNLLDRFVDDLNDNGQVTFENLGSNETQKNLRKLMKIAEVISTNYDIVVTNPPYMGNRGMSSKLNNYVALNYSEAKADLFAVFMVKGINLLKNNGLLAYVTMQAWLFLSSYEKLRIMFAGKKIDSLLKIGFNSFPELNSQVAHATAFVAQNVSVSAFRGKYFELNTSKTNDDKERVFLKKRITEDYFKVASEQFVKYPNCNYAFWLSDNEQKILVNEKKLGDLIDIRQGLATGDNDRFLREWYEVDYNKIAFKCKNAIEFIESKKTYVPYNKSGDYRKWYGNFSTVINWENNGYSIKNFKDEKGKLRSRPQNVDYYFRRGITWSLISTNTFAARLSPGGFIFDVGGSSGFANEDMILYGLGLLCSKIAYNFLSAFNPTINFQIGDIKNIPVIVDETRVDEINENVKQCIQISKSEWDSYETSWNYIRNPLIELGLRELFDKVSDSLNFYQNDISRKIINLKEYEENINHIFLQIYNLDQQYTDEVADKTISIRNITLREIIVNMISYAVGCMLGRYSLDIDGLAFASGEWDNNKYTTFIPDCDNIIPITDEEYFSDDIVGRFVEFIKTVYGADTLEENLDFIANALGNKGATSREVIRNYFLKDFYADHLKVYQKRPIYWLFDSGKQNGFKALIYMHRYDADTVGRVRTDYLHKAQKYVETAMQSAQYTIDNATSASEKSKATKAVTKYTKQLAEMKIYDEAIAHVANQRIEIDLDDGVKVNYTKFQGVEVAQEGKKALKVDLLAKIK